MHRGWISIHRKITEHWLYEEERVFSKYEAWIDLLLMANYKGKKIYVDGKLVRVKRGQCMTSIRKLCHRWQWSNTKVRNFLHMLEAEEMIRLKTDRKKTMITIKNYDIYQTNERKNDSQAYVKHTNNNEEQHNKQIIHCADDHFLPEYQIGF